MTDTDKTSMSKLGEMMSKLKDLEHTDPAKAKQVLQAIASKLNDAASSATGDDAAHLKDLASKFTKAADTGDVSSLQPTKGHHHSHHHHAPPAAAASSDPSTDSSTTNSKTEAYKAHAGSQMDQVASIMQDALSSIGA